MDQQCPRNSQGQGLCLACCPPTLNKGPDIVFVEAPGCF